MALSVEQVQLLRPVLYEWEMLVAAAERLERAVLAEDRILENLLLEAFVVHFRQLGNFFSSSPEQGDLHVRDFFEGKSWRTVTGRKNRWADFLRPTPSRI
jgi:hypothetical protein